MAYLIFYIIGFYGLWDFLKAWEAEREKRRVPLTAAEHQSKSDHARRRAQPEYQANTSRLFR
jgi:hypothetical protein